MIISPCHDKFCNVSIGKVIGSIPFGQRVYYYGYRYKCGHNDTLLDSFNVNTDKTIIMIMVYFTLQ